MIPERMKDVCDSAPDLAREQRLQFTHLMKADTTKAGTEEGSKLCLRMMELATADPVRWDAQLPRKEVAELFRRGALYFGGST